MGNYIIYRHLETILLQRHLLEEERRTQVNEFNLNVGGLLIHDLKPTNIFLTTSNYYLKIVLLSKQ